MPALTRTFDPKVGPLIQVIISLPGQMRSLAGQTGRESLELNSYDFLVDTGADTTCISSVCQKTPFLAGFPAESQAAPRPPLLQEPGTRPKNIKLSKTQ